VESQPQTGSWLRVQANGLDATQRDVLGLLALHGEVNIAICSLGGGRQGKHVEVAFGRANVRANVGGPQKWARESA
jgi:hypothetical protein